MDAMSHNEEVKEAISAEPFEPAAPLPPIDSQLSGQTIEQSENVWTPKPPQPQRIAPVWHTLILVLGILAFSIWGSARSGSPVNNPFAPVHSATNGSPAGTDHVRLIRYALTGTLEILVVIWVAFGLRLRKVSFRSLFGKWPRGLNDITMEAGVAVGLLDLLHDRPGLHCALMGRGSERNLPASDCKPIQPIPSQSAIPRKKKSPQQQQAEMARQLMELAPADGIEVASWGLLCLIVGFSEEVIFRGYLQSQSIALLRSVPIAVAVTAVIFGAAHGYQGLRGIVLISAYGGLFGGITLLRKNLFPGMLAHAWHDFATGMLLAFIRSTHLLERLPLSH